MQTAELCRPQKRNTAASQLLAYEGPRRGRREASKSGRPFTLEAGKISAPFFFCETAAVMGKADSYMLKMAGVLLDNEVRVGTQG